MDRIPERALERIRSADILIALLSEQNQAVAYELGYRRARERTVILMVDSQDDLPVYEKAVAYQDWRQDDVLKAIDSIAGSDFPPLADFEVDIPDALKAAIDAKDDGLIQNLQLALQEIEQGFGLWFGPDPVQRLRGILSDEITRLYPFSVVEVSFSKKGEFEDPEAPAKVVDFDEAFSRLYGYAGIIVAKQDTPHTLDRLLNRIAQFSDKDDWEKFLEEQVKLTDSVIKKYQPARATVPIRINSSHSDAGFRSKSFLPCMTSYVIDGDLDGPHRMYLLVAYIEVPNETAHLLTRGEG